MFLYDFLTFWKGDWETLCLTSRENTLTSPHFLLKIFCFFCFLFPKPNLLTEFLVQEIYFFVPEPYVFLLIFTLICSLIYVVISFCNIYYIVTTIYILQIVNDTQYNHSLNIVLAIWFNKSYTYNWWFGYFTYISNTWHDLNTVNNVYRLVLSYKCLSAFTFNVLCRPWTCPETQQYTWSYFLSQLDCLLSKQSRIFSLDMCVS